MISLQLLGTSHAGEPVDVVRASVHGVFGLIVFVALLHSAHHASAAAVSKVVYGGSEVGAKEVGESRVARLRSLEACHLFGVGRREEERCINLEPLHIRVQKVSVAHDPGALEGMSRDEGGMGVVCID